MWWVFAVAACISTAAFGQTSTTPDYSVAAIEYSPGPLTRVGSVKAGLLCLPKGRLRWRDVARPADVTLMRLVTAVLEANGLSVASPPDPVFGDPPPMTRYRVRVVVTAMTMRLCVAGLGIGEKKPSGEGTLSIRWDTFDRAARTLIDRQVFDVPIIAQGRDPRTSVAPFGEALSVGAARYARSRAQAQ